MTNMFNIQYFFAGSSWATCKEKYANSGHASQNPSGGALFGAFCFKIKTKEEKLCGLDFKQKSLKNRLPSNPLGISNQALSKPSP